MKKKLITGLFVFALLFTVTGCGNNDEKESKINEKNKIGKLYECRYSKDDNAEGKRYLTKYEVFLNNKNESTTYTIISGFSNYGSETDGYKDFCNSLKDNKQDDLLEKYKDSVNMEVVCDEENNYEAYVSKTYQIKKIKDISDFSKVYESIKPYIKDDGTFDLDAWKNYFDTDSLKAGNYTCNF